MKVKKTLKTHLSWVPLGMERAARKLVFWIKEPSDKNKVRRRFWITVGTPTGFIVLTCQYPALSVIGSFTILIGVSAWYGQEEIREMTVREAEYQMPYEVDGEVMTGGEVLRTLIAAHPGEGLEDLAERLSRHAEGSGVTAEALGRDMEAWGIPIPRKSSPSPTEDLAPSGADESAGQDHEEESEAPDFPESGGGVVDSTEVTRSERPEVPSDDGQEREGTAPEEGEPRLEPSAHDGAVAAP